MKSESGRMKGDLKERTKEFALNIIGLYSQLPKRREAQVLGDQLLRSGTSVGAHFREAQRAKSNPDFISKIEGGMSDRRRVDSEHDHVSRSRWFSEFETRARLFAFFSVSTLITHRCSDAPESCKVLF